MEKELLNSNKELLLKDLCARLPYGVKYNCGGYDDCDYMMTKVSLNIVDGAFSIEEVKPYLFPLSSMTEEQEKEYHELIGGMFSTSVLINFEALEDFFNRNHFDYRGLIPKGLAIDATRINIYWLWKKNYLM